MSHMTEGQRLQFDRPDLKGTDVSVRTKSNRWLYVYMAIAVVVAGLLSWQAIERIDGWASLVVLGGIIMTAVGMIIAVSPNRES
ncbi:MAG: hypothetical protein ACR2OC_02555 [Solirubrobacterales bacterium]